MPNIKKRTEAKKQCLSLAFRFRASEVQSGAALGQVANHILKSWCYGIKRMEKADNDHRHNVLHKGVGRAERRKGLKRKGA